MNFLDSQNKEKKNFFTFTSLSLLSCISCRSIMRLILYYCLWSFVQMYGLLNTRKEVNLLAKRLHILSVFTSLLNNFPMNHNCKVVNTTSRVSANHVIHTGYVDEKKISFYIS